MTTLMVCPDVYALTILSALADAACWSPVTTAVDGGYETISKWMICLQGEVRAAR